MAIKPEEKPTAPAKATAARSSRRRSELDLTKRNVGPVWRQYLPAMGPGLVTGASADETSGLPPIPGPRPVRMSLIVKRVCLGLSTGLAGRRHERGHGPLVMVRWRCIS